MVEKIKTATTKGMKDWKPIEIAPKGKAQFLVASECGKIGIARRDGNGYCLMVAQITEAIKFWMPLPKPPTTNNN